MTNATPGNKSLTVLSYGGGQDSTALLYKLAFDQDFRNRYAPGRLLVIMADTKDEHPETVKHVEETKTFCAKEGIEFAHITPDMGYHGGKWQGYREFLNATRTCGSKAFRKTCTDNLKLKPIYRYLEEWISMNYGTVCGRKRGFYQFVHQGRGKVRIIIGIAAGEEKRIGAPLEKWAQETTERCYPLVDLGMDRKACQDYIASTGRKVPPPSNCILCPFMSDIELLWLYNHMPEDFEDWCRIEQAKLDRFESEGLPREKNLTVWGKKTLREKLAEAQAKYSHMTSEEIDDYKFSHGHCVMSKY